MDKEKNEKYIIAIDNGFVFIGELREEENNSFTILDCYNIREYGTANGLGELALKGKQENTKLDYFGVLNFPKSRMLFKIICTHESYR